MKGIAFVVLFSCVLSVSGVHRPNHFGNPCYLCDCFVEYEDRDQAISSIPYKIANNGYDTTEDQCLATCLNDEKCKAVVYAFTGGRNVFSCELYDEVNIRDPIYTPYTNLYLKRVSKCQKTTHHLRPIDLIDGDESRMRLLITLLLVSTITVIDGQLVQMDRDGCGETKGCLFKPAGCDPMRDCTIGIIFYVSGPNLLTIQVVALGLFPAPSLQYVAIGFSHDSNMGDDMVTECVLSPTGDEFATEPEVFVSYNIGKTNDRTYLNQTELEMLIRDVQGEAVNGRVSCQWAQEIIPQQSSKGGRLWNLNHKYYIIGATGSAQPDEINAHDLAIGSHFYPIVSARPINPSVIGVKLYDLPKPFVDPVPEPQTTTSPPRPPHQGSTSTTFSLALVVTSFFIFLMGN